MAIKLIESDKLFAPKSLYKIMGFERSLILSTIAYQIREHETKGHNFREGTTWYYTSCQAMSEWQEILTEKQVRDCIKWLIEKGWLIKHAKGFNQTAYDRTSWYALGPQCLESGLFTDVTKRSNGFTEKVEPIPSSTKLPSSSKETTGKKEKVGKAKQKQLDAFEKKAKRDAIFASLSQPMQSLVDDTMSKGSVDKLEPLLRQLEADVPFGDLSMLARLVRLRASQDESVKFLSLSSTQNLWKDFFKNLENAKAWVAKNPHATDTQSKPDRSAEAREMLAKFDKDFTDASDYDELDNLIEAAYSKKQFMLNHLMADEVFFVFDKAKKYLAFLKTQRNSNQ